MTDTITAIATAGGIGSIAIVRLSGPDALTIAHSIAPKASFVARQADLASLYDADALLIDQGIVIYFEAPHSFTGEAIVEFQCHGGRVVAGEILRSTLARGARLADPGEFSKRAFLNGKIDLSEAEAIARAREEAAMRMRKVREDAERAAAQRAATRKKPTAPAASGDAPRRGRPQLRVVEGSAERRQGGA